MVNLIIELLIFLLHDAPINQFSIQIKNGTKTGLRLPFFSVKGSIGLVNRRQKQQHCKRYFAYRKCLPICSGCQHFGLQFRNVLGNLHHFT